MTDAFIYDHVRTPRGRGKPDGALHEVTALNLAAQALGAIKDRNKLDPSRLHIGQVLYVPNAGPGKGPAAAPSLPVNSELRPGPARRRAHGPRRDPECGADLLGRPALGGGQEHRRPLD